MKKMLDNNFWLSLDSGFSALAPMADVTDCAFRKMFLLHGRPDVFWTEFVSADGLFLAPEQGRQFWLPEDLRHTAVEHGIASDNPLLKDLIFDKGQSPIVTQFFSRDPERMKRSAKLAVALGFDGIDINMGCPARVIVKQGAGCAMIQQPAEARQVIEAAIAGAAGQIPVSVKTRTGFNSDNESYDWFRLLLDTGIKALTLHARTRKDMSKVPARWENVRDLVELRNKYNPEVKIIGNGDVSDLSQCKIRAQESGADGVMIGRGIFGNPWIFNAAVDKKTLTDKAIIESLLQHSDWFNKYLGDTKSFALMRKHYKSYLRDTNLTKTQKQQFLTINFYSELVELVSNIKYDPKENVLSL